MKTSQLQSEFNGGARSLSLRRQVSFSSSKPVESNGDGKKSFLKRFFGKGKRRTSLRSALLILEPTKPLACSNDPVKEITVVVQSNGILPSMIQLEVTMQMHLEDLLKKRGYENLQYYETLKTGYHRTATELQLASYGAQTIQIVRSSDLAALEQVLAGGFSPNACNKFNESLLHMACRHGKVALLYAMADAGASVQVCDDYGRTPLHDAFWAPEPAFAVVEHLVERDPGMLFLKDRRGFLPLDYVAKENWPAWKEWFDQHVDTFFPEMHARVFEGPELASFGPNTVALPESKPVFPLKLIKLVANNVMSLEEAITVAQEDDEANEVETAAATELGTDYDEESEYGSDSDFDSDCSYSTEEDEEYCNFADNEEMMKLLGHAKKVETQTP